RQDDRFLEQQFRPRLLASILRFADEISDDSSRADKLMMDLKKIEPTTQSAIHHAYSTSLSSSSVESDDGHTAYVRLEYNIYEQTLTVEYQKGNGTVFLIDEIFERVRKMEYERQYCSKYFGFILPLTEIKFSISIHSEIDRTKCETLSYTLSDMGYPTHKVEIKGQYVSNNSIIKHLNEKGWEIKDDERKDQ
ncbi:MAG: hypothetical protein FWD96_00580, partial [Defluviitaleaceae bacterium]|nr:hypothetical protein [Defluviitaleaceae bacterium]